MRRLLVVLSIAALMGVGLSPTWPQESTSGPAAQPVPIIQGQSAAPSGGITSGATATETPAQSPPAPLRRGPPAGPQRAEYLSSRAILGGAAAATAIVVCALACFSRSSRTTTSTTAQHH